MLIKVCGLVEEVNMNKVSLADIDMIGLNFYPSSKRYLSHNINTSKIPKHISKVGVFVNESLDEILRLIDKYELDYVQLHGDEDNDFCKKLKEKVKVIKVIPIRSSKDFQMAKNYPEADFILFDTKTKMFGGSGKKFDWSILEQYDGEKPFILAGGIKPDDVKTLKEISHEAFAGIDINSQFESEPGIKSVPEVYKFAYAIKNESY